MRSDGEKEDRVPLGGLFGKVARLSKLFIPAGQAVVAFFYGWERATKTMAEKNLVLIGAPILFLMFGLFVYLLADLLHPAGDNFLLVILCVGAGFLLAALVNDLRSKE